MPQIKLILRLNPVDDLHELVLYDELTGDVVTLDVKSPDNYDDFDFVNFFIGEYEKVEKPEKIGGTINKGKYIEMLNAESKLSLAKKLAVLEALFDVEDEE